MQALPTPPHPSSPSGATRGPLWPNPPDHITGHPTWAGPSWASLPGRPSARGSPSLGPAEPTQSSSGLSLALTVHPLRREVRQVSDGSGPPGCRAWGPHQGHSCGSYWTGLAAGRPPRTAPPIPGPQAAQFRAHFWGYPPCVGGALPAPPTGGCQPPSSAVLTSPELWAGT